MNQRIPVKDLILPKLKNENQSNKKGVPKTDVHVSGGALILLYVRASDMCRELLLHSYCGALSFLDFHFLVLNSRSSPQGFFSGPLSDIRQAF